MAINLSKGQKIDLRKESGSELTNFCVGANWGAIESKGFFGLSTNKTNVDLDLSCVLVDNNNNMVDFIYSPLYNLSVLQKFGLQKGKLSTFDQAMRHTGDDLQGDSGGDDGLDNEIITVDLTKINPNVSKIYFFLNNVGKEDFSMIPYAKIRMFEGTATRVNSVFASYNVAAEPQYKGKTALILGKLYKRNDQWKFDAIGDPTEDSFLGQTIKRIMQSYL